MDENEKTELLNILNGIYFTRSADAGFAIGSRARFLYALRSAEVGYSKVNPRGPEPKEYLDFARRDLEDETPRGLINALGNAKRAVHLAIDAFLRIYALGGLAAGQPFPVVLDLLQDLGAFPVRLVKSLNRKRNLVEHEYDTPSCDEARDFAEIAELFVTLAYGYLQRSVVGVYAGVLGGDVCTEYLLDGSKPAIQVFNVEPRHRLETQDGAIHYGMQRQDRHELVNTIPLVKDRRLDWLPILDLFIYCTKGREFRLRGLGSPGSLSPTRVHFELSDTRDEYGRRQFTVVETTEAPVRLMLADSRQARGAKTGQRG